MTDSVQIKKIVSNTIDSHQSDIIKTLGDLVNIPSVTGNEGAAQKCVESLYRGLGLEVVTFEPDLEQLMKHPAFSRRDNNPGYKGRPNVLGIFKGTKTASP